MNAPQGSPQWVAARRGFLGASRVKDALAKTKSGWSESRRKLAGEIAFERWSGTAVDHFVTPAMEHGIEYEASAVAAYETLTGNITTECGFILHPRIEFFGATPDRLIGFDGVLECKCPTTAKYISWLVDGKVPKEHELQLLAQLACTGRKYADFVAYDPRVPESKRTFVRRFEPREGQIAEMEEQVSEFLNEVEVLFEFLSTQPMAA